MHHIANAQVVAGSDSTMKPSTAPKLRVIVRDSLLGTASAPHAHSSSSQIQVHRAGASQAGTVQWRDTVILTHNGALLMAIAIAPDGMVWSYRPQASAAATSATAATEPMVDGQFFETDGEIKHVQQSAQPQVLLRCTHLCAQTIAVGFDRQNRIVVFGGQELDLEYVVCTDADDMRWSAPRSAHLDIPANATQVERIYTQHLDGSLHVGAMIGVRQTDGSSLYKASYANWDEDGADFQDTPIFVNSLQNLKAEHILQNAARSVMMH